MEHDLTQVQTFTIQPAARIAMTVLDKHGEFSFEVDAVLTKENVQRRINQMLDQSAEGILLVQYNGKYYSVIGKPGKYKTTPVNPKAHVWLRMNPNLCKFFEEVL